MQLLKPISINLNIDGQISKEDETKFRSKIEELVELIDNYYDTMPKSFEKYKEGYEAVTGVLYDISQLTEVDVHGFKLSKEDIDSLMATSTSVDDKNHDKIQGLKKEILEIIKNNFDLLFNFYEENYQ